MEENTNNKYAEFDTIVKEVTRELSSSVLVHPAKETFKSMAIHCVYAYVIDIFATIDINMPNEKLIDMMHNLTMFWTKLLANDCFECDNSQSITSHIDRMLDITHDKVCETNNEVSEYIKADENNGKLFNKAAYAAFHELERAEVHEDKIPANQVWRVYETMDNLRRILFRISAEKWNTSSMESLYWLNSLIREARIRWSYIRLLDKECVKCDRLLIQWELSHMFVWIFAESCCNHRNEYMEYITLNDKSNNEEDK